MRREGVYRISSSFLVILIPIIYMLTLVYKDVHIRLAIHRGHNASACMRLWHARIQIHIDDLYTYQIYVTNESKNSASIKHICGVFLNTNQAEYRLPE